MFYFEGLYDVIWDILCTSILLLFANLLLLGMKNQLPQIFSHVLYHVYSNEYVKYDMFF